jgi:hypothetical protein
MQNGGSGPVTTRSPVSFPVTCSSPSLAIRNDEELNRLLGSVVISQGGVLPNIHSELLPSYVRFARFSSNSPLTASPIKANPRRAAKAMQVKRCSEPGFVLKKSNFAMSSSSILVPNLNEAIMKME